MSQIPSKVIERYNKNVSRFQKILKQGRDRDINEADTVSITKGILAEVFGFDKYVDVTSEFAIRGTYCDLGVKIDGKIQFLIEVKAIGLSLKNDHLRQVVDYGAKQGAQWVILTNGIEWQLHRIQFEKPITHELVSMFDFLELSPRRQGDRDKLYVLSKEGIKKSAREDLYERVKVVNRFTIAALAISDSTINSIRRDIKKLSTGVKVDADEIRKILINEVLKRDVIEGDDAGHAASMVRKLKRKIKKKSQSVKLTRGLQGQEGESK